MNAAATAKLAVNLTRGTAVCEQVTLADTASQRMRGLLGRDSLANGEGMLLHPAPSIHTAFMRFAIDAVFLDGTLCVKKVVACLAPWRIAASRRGWGVLELAAGEAARRGIRVGDQLAVVDVTDNLDRMLSGLSAVTAPAAAVVSEEPEPLDDLHRTLPPHSDDDDDALKVLIVGKDRRFRAVAAALLTRRGCRVWLEDANPSTAGYVPSVAADVAIVDVGSYGLPPEDFHLGTAGHELPVILVVDQPAEAQPRRDLLHKWGSFNELYDAVSAASTKDASELASGHPH